MPITNNLFGVWKILQWNDTNLSISDKRFIVEQAQQGAEQDVTPEHFVQGTALPIILNIGGSKATMQVTAPLLVREHENYRVTGLSDPVHDGFHMWQCVFQSGGTNSMLEADYEQETGFIVNQASFSINAQSGARYTFGFEGDSDYLGEETGIATGNGFTLIDGFPDTNPPIPVGEPLRVAAFYDVIVQVGNLTGYAEEIEVSYQFQTNGFNYLGQPTQRQILGISGAQVSFQGTMINSTRSPLGYEFPWQSMNSENDITIGSSTKVPSGYETWGGTAKSSDLSLNVYMRNGASTGVQLMPNVTVDDTVFQSSQVNISSDLIRTNFNGMGWISDASLIS